MVGEPSMSKKKGNAALLSRPTGITTLEKTISVPSNGVLGEAPSVRRLLLAVDTSIGPVFFLKVLGAPWGQGNTQKRKQVSIQHYSRVQQGTLL